MTALNERRGFLRGLVSLPLIGGGVTLIGKPARAAVPLVDAIGAPLLANPQERFRYAWAALSAAMREIVPANADGWFVHGGERTPRHGRVPGGDWCERRGIFYVHEPDTRCPDLLVERHWKPPS